MLSYQSRLQGVNVWSSLVFVMNGLIFFLIGLQLPSIIQQLGSISLSSAIWYGLVISLILILARFICAYGAVLFTRFMSRYITVADPNPGWKAPLIIGWAGMRKTISEEASFRRLSPSITLTMDLGAFTCRMIVVAETASGGEMIPPSKKPRASVNPGIMA